MRFDAKKALLAVVVLAALSLAFWPLQLALYSFVKTFYEGNSIGKTLGFLGWLALYFGVLALRQRKRLPHLFSSNPRPFRWFLYTAALASLTGFFLHFLLLYQFVPAPLTPADFSSIIGTMTGSGSALEWEASYTGHTHEGKIALALLARLLPPGLKADTGWPLYEIIPFSPLFSLFLLALLLLAAFFALQEGVASCTGGHNIRPVLWAFVSYGVMVLMLDGNVFTVASQLMLGLLLYYFLRTRTTLLARPWQHVAYPVFGLGGLLFLLSYAFGVTLAATYAVSVLVFCLLCLTARSYKRAFPPKALWLALLLFFGYHAFDALVGAGLGRVLHPGDQAEFFAYGVPPQATEAQVRELLAPLLDNAWVDRHGWLTFFRGTARTLTVPKLIELRLAEGLQPRGYFDVVYLNGTDYRAGVRSPYRLEGLPQIKSAFVSFAPAGENKFVAEGKIDPLYMNLFVLNYLRDQGIQNPVALTR